MHVALVLYILGKTKAQLFFASAVHRRIRSVLFFICTKISKSIGTKSHLGNVLSHTFSFSVAGPLQDIKYMYRMLRFE